jgi:hypothetical protein
MLRFIPMGVDWSEIKKTTLWSYEELVEKLTNTLSYDFVSQYYDRKIGKVPQFLVSLLKRKDDKHAPYLASVLATLMDIEIFGVGTISGFLEFIPTREQFEHFIHISRIEFRGLVRLLNCLLRWILPFSRPIAEFIKREESIESKYLAVLREHGVRFNLDMLEQYRQKSSRDELGEAVPVSYVVELLHRTDISRLPYVSGKTVHILSGAGYNTLDRIAGATQEQFEESVSTYIDSIGLKYSRSFLDIEGAINQARAIPRILEL